ncbi:MAG: hypothetical protein AYK18_13540 [Theionarchaea archaeon DG-70]|nr:MAG: hypothetical protein AYK18_13540 [Theionarchaea archaeon DG-70]
MIGNENWTKSLEEIIKTGIPESQLEIWSHQGAVKTAKATHESIRRALNSHEWPYNIDFEVYLQGSYKNSTNIRGDSDVDIVVQLNSTFLPGLANLSLYGGIIFNWAYPNAAYLWEHFRADVLQALENYYGTSGISEGNKSLKVAGNSGRLPADVVVCLQYRGYQYFRSRYDEQYVEGIVFYSFRENQWILNFPKQHYNNGVTKNEETNGWYKRTVRVFKNARTYIVNKGVISENLAPSYFLECLLYNVPNIYFGNNYKESFSNIIDWLLYTFSSNNYRVFLCQNELLPLFGDEPEQWSVNDAIELLVALTELWSDW